MTYRNNVTNKETFKVVLISIFSFIFFISIKSKDRFLIPTLYKYGKIDKSINRKTFKSGQQVEKIISAEYQILNSKPDTLILTKLFINNVLSDSIIENIRTKEILRFQFLNINGKNVIGTTQISIIAESRDSLVKMEKVDFNIIKTETISKSIKYSQNLKDPKNISIAINKTINWENFETKKTGKIIAVDSLIYQKDVGLIEMYYKIIHPNIQSYNYRLAGL